MKIAILCMIILILQAVGLLLHIGGRLEGKRIAESCSIEKIVEINDQVYTCDYLMEY